MTIAVLLWPHSNRRYFDSVKSLSLQELGIILGSKGDLGPPRLETMNGLELICFEAKQGDQDLLDRLRFFSAGYAIFEKREESLIPIGPGGQLKYGQDLSGILKYKGKTNEMFTGLLLNVAVFSSAFGPKFNQKLSVLDPMCGRGTTLFEALRRGYDATGIETDKTDISQINQFFKKYLEFNKIKHGLDIRSLTAQGAPSARSSVYTFAPDARALKEEPECLEVIHGDTLNAAKYLKKDRFHAIVADLPYGIAHESRDGKSKVALDQMMEKALSAWYKVLRPGGAIALSFNGYTLSLEQARRMVEQAGFEPKVGPSYDHFSHWVEQAIMRDIVVGVKR